MAGLTAEGLEIKRLEDIRNDMSARAIATFGPTTNTDPDSALGQLIDVFAQELSLVWELAQQDYDSFDPDQAEGAQLDNLSAIVGVNRLPASFSTGDVVLTGDLGTLIPTGSQVQTATEVRFETVADVTFAALLLNTGSLTFSDVDNSVTRTIGSWITDGVVEGVDVDFAGTLLNNGAGVVESIVDASKIILAAGFTVSNEGPLAASASLRGAVASVRGIEAGPLQAFAQEINEIVTPVNGWDTVINPADIDTGQTVENDLDLRVRREESLQITGAAVDNAIRAQLRQIQGVEQALVISNRSDVTDSDGRPPHSFESIIYPNPNDPSFDEQIVTTIFNLQPAGIQAFGSLNFNVTDSQGFAQPVGFSYATEREMFVRAILTTNQDYPANGDEQVAAVLLAQGNLLSVGDDVLIWKFTGALDGNEELRALGFSAIPGIVTVEIRIEEVNPPTNTANIPIAFREIAVFDSSRIEVNP